MQLRRSIVAAIWLVIALAILWQIFDFVVVNEGIRYFAAEPIRILLALGVGVIGGLGVLGWHQLPERQRRVAKLILSTSCAIALSAFAVSFVSLLWSLKSTDVALPSPWQIAGITIGFVILGGFAWWEFFRTLKHKESLFF